MDRSIEKPVDDGQKARNLYNDVVTIQQLLNDITPANAGANWATFPENVRKRTR